MATGLLPFEVGKGLNLFFAEEVLVVAREEVVVHDHPTGLGQYQRLDIFDDRLIGLELLFHAVVEPPEVLDLDRRQLAPHVAAVDGGRGQYATCD